MSDFYYRIIYKINHKSLVRDNDCLFFIKRKEKDSYLGHKNIKDLRTLDRTEQLLVLKPLQLNKMINSQYINLLFKLDDYIQVCEVVRIISAEELEKLKILE